MRSTGHAKIICLVKWHNLFAINSLSLAIMRWCHLTWCLSRYFYRQFRLEGLVLHKQYNAGIWMGMCNCANYMPYMPRIHYVIGDIRGSCNHMNMQLKTWKAQYAIGRIFSRNVMELKSIHSYRKQYYRLDVKLIIPPNVACYLFLKARIDSWSVKINYVTEVGDAYMRQQVESSSLSELMPIYFRSDFQTYYGEIWIKLQQISNWSCRRAHHVLASSCNFTNDFVIHS